MVMKRELDRAPDPVWTIREEGRPMAASIESASVRAVSPASVQDDMQRTKEALADQYSSVLAQLEEVNRQRSFLEETRLQIETAVDALDRFLQPQDVTRG